MTAPITKEQHDLMVLRLIALGVTYFGHVIKYGAINVKLPGMYVQADAFVDELTLRGYWPIPDPPPQEGP